MSIDLVDFLKVTEIQHLDYCVKYILKVKKLGLLSHVLTRAGFHQS